MLKGIFHKKNYPFLFLDIFLFLSCFLFVDDSLGRFLFLLFSILLYIFLSLCLKNRVISSVLYILITLPFNITYQIPQTVKIFSSTVTFYDSYVNGVSVNYLIPTLSIVDLGFFLLLYSLLFSSTSSFLKKIFLKYRLCFCAVLVSFGVNLFLNMDLLQVVNTFRILIYLCTFVLSVHWIIENRKVFTKELKIFFWVAVFISVCIQGVFACIQFSKGTSLGMDFLGESNVVSGMAGSSFIELDNRLFLRGYGTFPHPNVLAGFFLFSFLFFLTLFLKEKGFFKTLAGVSMVVAMAFSLFSFSRVVIFLLLFNCLGIFCQKIYARRYCAAYFVPFRYLYERFLNIFDSGDSSLSERMDLAKCSFKVIKEDWFWGCGLGKFVRAIEDFVPRSKNGIMILQPVHNIFLLSLSEMGVLGFMSFWFTLLKVLWGGIKNFNIMVFLILLDILVVGSFDHYLLDLPQGFGIFFLLLLLCIMNSLGKNEEV